MAMAVQTINPSHSSSSPSNSPIPSDSNSTMSSPNHESTDPQTPTNPSDASAENTNDPDQPADGESSNSGGGIKGQEGEEDEGECGFCLFMKAGGCKESFVAWETCVDEAEKKGDDIAMKCWEATAALKNCMEAHADYYEPILKAEKVAQEEAIRELEKEKGAKDSEQNLESKEDLKKN